MTMSICVCTMARHGGVSFGGDNREEKCENVVICTSNVYYVMLESFVRFVFSQWVEVRAPDNLGCK